MAETRVERRLTAILAADVAGYSRLMGVDEEATLEALKAHRNERIDPKIAEHRAAAMAGPVRIIRTKSTNNPREVGRQITPMVRDFSTRRL